MRTLRHLFAISLTWFASAHASPCLVYGAPGTTLQGIVTVETFYGPPNFGESPETDSKVRQAILRLDSPICTQESADEPAELGQVRITLAPTGGLNLDAHAGKRVTVTGALFHASTGHHRTPLLMAIRQAPQRHQ